MITLIGKSLANEGLEFVFKGPASECESCRFKPSCVDNLEENRKYVVMEVRDNEQKCPIHDENKVVPVVVELANINILTNSKNIFEGSTFTYNPLDCDEYCEFHDFCFPEGLVENDKCIVIKNNGKHDGECIKGYKLNKHSLGFVV